MIRARMRLVAPSKAFSGSSPMSKWACASSQITFFGVLEIYGQNKLANATGYSIVTAQSISAPQLVCTARRQIEIPDGQAHQYQLEFVGQ